MMTSLTFPTPLFNPFHHHLEHLAFNLGQRGEIKEGYFADLVIFNKHEISDASTYDEPFNPPKGIYFVLVNGQIVFENGNERAIYPGRPIRRAIW
jgi:N-acyl-D-amino-acid deacylase